jgi:hypothetical protein
MDSHVDSTEALFAANPLNVRSKDTTKFRSTTNFTGACNRGFQIGTHTGNINHIVTNTSEDREYLKSLFVTDPRIDKTRIQQTKGGLLPDVYEWVLHTPEFTRWRSEPQ